MKLIEGHLDGRGHRIAVICARFNDAITERLLASALDCLRRHGVRDADVTVARVPGAFELPLTARAFAGSGDHDGLVCLGAIIRGATAHFDVLASEVTGGIARAMSETGVPIGFGVLTCETLDQAVERSGGKGSNKGWEAAITVLEMVNLLREAKLRPAVAD